MTLRRVVLYTAATAALAYIAACAAILHAQDRRDYWTGWYDRGPRCLP